jgi:hypothetical protein
MAVKGTYGESCVYDFLTWRPSELEQLEVECSTKSAYVHMPKGDHTTIAEVTIFNIYR